MRRQIALVVAVLLFSASALADCDRDLATADILVHAVRLREPDINRLHAQNDVAGTCRLLNANVRDMSKARDIMDRCLTGFERRENVSQLDVSIEDVRSAIGSYCR